jgi:pimeloyl-ACP methyl ester carboxylesterase
MKIAASLRDFGLRSWDCGLNDSRCNIDHKNHIAVITNRHPQSQIRNYPTAVCRNPIACLCLQVMSHSIKHREQGSGTPLVLVHGFPLDGRIFDDQLAGLSHRYRVIVPDLPGFGASQPYDVSTMSLSWVARELHAFLQSINALPCVLGGLSMGGYVALPFVRAFPADVAALLLIDTRAEADNEEGKANRDRMIEAAKARGTPAVVEMMFGKMLAQSTVHQKPAVAKKLKEIMSAQPVETICAAIKAMRDRDDFSPLLPAIRTPTVVMVGEFDAITPPAVAEKVRAALPRSWLVTIEGAGHVSTMEQPEKVNAAILKVLDEVK